MSDRTTILITWKDAGIRLLVSTLILAAAACRSVALPPTYYEAWEKAGALYWGEPRDQEGAIALLESACKKIKDRQDVSCYNWGVLLEMEGRTSEAARAYARAAALSPEQPYIEAARSIDEKSESTDTPYLASMRSMTLACKMSSGVDGALSQVASLPQASLPTRETMEQPFFASCLKDKPAYTALLLRLPRSGKSMDAAWHRARASHHTFAGLFDIEIVNRRLIMTADSRHAITKAWQTTLRAADRGDGSGCAAALGEYFRLLRAASGDSRARALRRAGAVLVNSDEFFTKVKNDPGVQSVVQQEMRGL